MYSSSTQTGRECPSSWKILLMVLGSYIVFSLKPTLSTEGEIRLFCKGADTVIYERLAEGQEDIKVTTFTSLFFRM